MTKNFLLTFLFMLLSFTARANDNVAGKIVVSDLIFDEGMGAYFFRVSLAEGTQYFCAYKMELVLPSGMSVLSGKEDNGKVYYVSYMVEDESFYPKVVRNFKHSLGVSMVADNHYKFLCVDTDGNREFKATEGDLFDVYVTIDEEALSSSFSPKPIVKFACVTFALNDENNKVTGYTVDDFSCRPFSVGIPAKRELPLSISAKNKVGTLILPFSTDVPEGVKAYSCNSVNGELLVLNQEQTFEACKPYIVYSENGYSGTLAGEVDMTAEYPVDDVYSEGFLTGVLSPAVVSTGYIMQNKGAGPAFYNAEGSNFHLPAGRCYLTPSAETEAKSFGFSFDETTSITDVSSDTDSDAVIYNMMGQRILRPVSGQMYIKEGKKFFKR